MSRYRCDRLNELFKQEITKIIRFEIRDKRLSGITIEAVKISSDLQHARIFYSQFPHENQKGTEAGIRSALPFIRHRLAQIVNLRFTPELLFIFDTLQERAEQVENLIDEERKHFE